MKNRMCLVFCLVLLAATTAYSDESLTKLTNYEKERKLVSAGMCDADRTSLLRFTGKSYKEMVLIEPISQSSYFVVRTNNGKEEFFIERLGGTTRVVEQKATAMEWSMELARDSYNYFLYHFFKNDPAKKSDCGESPVKRKKKPKK